MNNIELETPTVYSAPNPLALMNVFVGILTSLTGVLTRQVGMEDQDKETGAANVNGIHTLCHLASFTQELQHSHWVLLTKTGMNKKFVKPLGEERFRWTTAQQVDEYQKIRDQALDVFMRVTAESIESTRFYISLECDDKIREALDQIQDCIYQANHIEIFEDGCASIAKGLKIATNAFEEIIKEIMPPGSEAES